MQLFRALGVIAAVAVLFGSAAARAQDAKTVYILPMSNGLDQFLAIKLTGSKVMQVVTDPKKAGVIFTDRIGEDFEQRLDDLYGQAPKQERDNDKDKDGDNAPVRRVSSGTHAKGAIFLVDRKTRTVIWSTYVKTRSTGADELNHAAEEITARLEKDFKTPAK